MNFCTLCPFQCGVDRVHRFGVCQLPNKLLVSHVQQHFFEEPFISGECNNEGTGGSGAVFFTGCNGRCVYCQNYKISQGEYWKKAPLHVVMAKELFEICRELVCEQKVHNINFVSPTSYTALLIPFLKKYKSKLGVPIIWNSNGYEKRETLQALKGLVDVYLPDFKYFDDAMAVRYSKMPNYLKWVTEALMEMFDQVGYPQLSADGFIEKGLVIRHLVLPGHLENSKKVLTWIRKTFGSKAYVALMAQYYPIHRSIDFPEIHRKLIGEEYREIKEYFLKLGFEDGL
ncbi:MAG: hypothetical protein UT55_C0031G0001, partial [Candidatus Peregrinibacteria bacterium GW2011_GWE2_39_6]